MKSFALFQGNARFFSNSIAHHQQQHQPMVLAHRQQQVDETRQPLANHLQQSPTPPRSPTFLGRRRSALLRGKTFDEDAASARNARAREYGNNTGSLDTAQAREHAPAHHPTRMTLTVGAGGGGGDASRVSTKVWVLYCPLVCLQPGSRREASPSATAERLENRIANIERMLQTLCNQRHGGEPVSC